MSEKAYINPVVLKWARQSAKMPVTEAAKKVNVDNIKLESWESGTDLPTIRQAEILAKSYKRPFALFFLPEPPKDFQPLQDFRKPSSDPLSTASLFIIREMQQKQAWISEMLEEMDENSLPFVGKYSLESSPKEVANDILITLNISPFEYSSNNPSVIVRQWISKAEAAGIFVSKTSYIHSHLKLDSEELQGFTIIDKYAPLIFINTEDWSSPLLFTFVHELAHIWINQPGVTNQISETASIKEKLHPVELFCNEVAALALIPEKWLNNIPSSKFNSPTEIQALAKSLGTSSLALLVRAYKAGKVDYDQYVKQRNIAQAAFEKYIAAEELKKEKQKEKAKEKGGGPNYYQLLLDRNGRMFTRFVINAFKGGLIAPTQASSLLNLRVNNFSKFDKFLEN